MPRPARHLRLVVGLIASFGLLALGVVGLQPAGARGGGGVAGAVGGAGELAALSTMPVPPPPALQRFVKNNTAAQKLGKALFWDMQAGAAGRPAGAPWPFNTGARNPSRHPSQPPARTLAP